MGTGKTQSSKQAIFSHAKQNEKMGHIWHNGIVRYSKIEN